MIRDGRVRHEAQCEMEMMRRPMQSNQISECSVETTIILKTECYLVRVPAELEELSYDGIALLADY